jgi:hypothetical protein
MSFGAAPDTEMSFRHQWIERASKAAGTEQSPPRRRVWLPKRPDAFESGLSR